MTRTNRHNGIDGARRALLGLVVAGGLVASLALNSRDALASHYITPPHHPHRVAIMHTPVPRAVDATQVIQRAHQPSAPASDADPAP